MRLLRFGFMAALAMMLAMTGKSEASHPLPPVNLFQLDSDGDTLFTGDSTEGSVNPYRVLLGASSNSQTWSGSCIYSLQFEVRPTGEAYTGVPTHTVVLGPKPDEGEVPYPTLNLTGLLPNTHYKWRCREVTDCGFKPDSTSLAPNGLPQGPSFGPWVDFNNGNTAFVTADWFVRFILGYIPHNATGVGRFFFFDKHPFPGAQSWRVEVRRNDSNVYLHKQTFNYPGGPPPGDVAGTDIFTLPLKEDPILFPTSYEVGLMIRVRVFSEPNQQGQELYTSKWYIDVHPSADLAYGPWIPELNLYPLPTGPGNQVVPFMDARPTGPNLSVLYDIIQKLTSGPQSQIKRVGHGIVGAFTEKKVHPPTLREVTAPVFSGQSLFFVRARHRYSLDNGQELGIYDVAHKSPNSYITVP